WLRTSVLRGDEADGTVSGAHLDVTDEHRALEALGLTTRQLREARGLGEVAGRKPTGGHGNPARRGARRSLSSVDRTYRAVWNALPASSGVLDRDGVVIEVNHAWVKLCRRYGRDDAFLGASYLEVAKRLADWGNARAGEAGEGVRRVLLGFVDSY